jgi:hypothetical protein
MLIGNSIKKIIGNSIKRKEYRMVKLTTAGEAKAVFN